MTASASALLRPWPWMPWSPKRTRTYQRCCRVNHDSMQLRTNTSRSCRGLSRRTGTALMAPSIASCTISLSRAARVARSVAVLQGSALASWGGNSPTQGKGGFVDSWQALHSTEADSCDAVTLCVVLRLVVRTYYLEFGVTTCVTTCTCTCTCTRAHVCGTVLSQS